MKGFVWNTLFVLAAIIGEALVVYVFIFGC